MQKSISRFFIIVLLATMAQVTSDLYLPSLPAIAVHFAVLASSAQWSVSLYIWGLAISQLFYGPFSDARGRKPALSLGLGLLLLGSIVCVAAPSITVLLLGRLLQGLGAGCCIALSRAVMRDCYSGARMAQIASFVAVIAIIMMAGAPLLGGYIQHHFGWHANFWFLFGFILLAVLLVVGCLPESHAPSARSHFTLAKWVSQVKMLFCSRAFVAAVGVTAFAYASILAWLTASPILLQSKLGLTPVQYGWAAVSTGLAYGIAGLGNGLVVKRFGVTRMMQLGVLLMICGALAMFLLFYVGHFITVTSILLPMIVYIAGCGFLFANAGSLALEAFAHMAGVASSVYGSVMVLGGAISSGLLAELPEHTPAPLIWVCLCCALLVLGLIRLLPAHSKS